MGLLHHPALPQRLCFGVFNHKYPQAASLLEVAAPSPSKPALNVFVRRLRKAALSFTWHEVEVWRLKAPAGKLVLILIS